MCTVILRHFGTLARYSKTEEQGIHARIYRLLARKVESVGY